MLLHAFKLKPLEPEADDHCEFKDNLVYTESCQEGLHREIKKSLLKSNRPSKK